MQITRIPQEEYESLFRPSHVFNTTGFARLNAPKADDVHFLAIGDKRQRFGIILGERGGALLSPFSAPFGGFDQLPAQRLEYYEEAAAHVCTYARHLGMPLTITLPPPIYGATDNAKWIHALSRVMSVRHIELNYHFELQRMTDYTSYIERGARKNLGHALKEDFCFVELDSSRKEDVERAYAVISANRRERGFPLRMTLEQVWQTVSRVVEADFFVAQHQGTDVAAAQVFHVAPGIGQVVYWGDKREFSSLRPMNFLTYNVFRHYHDAGFQLLDIGPSTEGGTPNYGLCAFKQAIGCSVTPKYCFEINNE